MLNYGALRRAMGLSKWLSLCISIFGCSPLQFDNWVKSEIFQLARILCKQRYLILAIEISNAPTISHCVVRSVTNDASTLV